MTENHGVPGSIPGLATRLLARRGAKFPSPEHLVPDGVPNPPVIALEALRARRTTARRGDPPPVARAGSQRQGDQAQDREWAPVPGLAGGVCGWTAAAHSLRTLDGRGLDLRP